MTREEAAKVLESSTAYRTAKMRGFFGELTQAMNIAISALRHVPDTNVGKVIERQVIEAVYTIRQYCRERYCSTDDCAIRDWCQEVCIFGLPEDWTITQGGEQNERTD